MDISKFFSSSGGRWLNAADISGETLRLQIANVTVERVGSDREEKLVLHFDGDTKPLILNKTNFSGLMAKFGRETDGWVDQWVELFTVPVECRGEMKEGIRLRPLASTAKLTTPPGGQGVAGVTGVPAAQGRAARVHYATDDVPF